MYVHVHVIQKYNTMFSIHTFINLIILNQYFKMTLVCRYTFYQISINSHYERLITCMLIV